MVVDDYYSQIHTDSSEPQQKSKKVVKKILVKYSCGGKVFYRRDQVLQSIVKLK